MKKLNKKGFMFTTGLGIMPLIMYGLFGINVGISAHITPEFRVNEAIEQCVESGSSQTYCEEFVASLSPEEVLDLIRDDGIDKDYALIDCGDYEVCGNGGKLVRGENKTSQRKLEESSQLALDSNDWYNQ